MHSGPPDEEDDEDELEDDEVDDDVDDVASVETLVDTAADVLLLASPLEPLLPSVELLDTEDSLALLLLEVSDDEDEVLTAVLEDPDDDVLSEPALLDDVPAADAEPVDDVAPWRLPVDAEAWLVALVPVDPTEDDAASALLLDSATPTTPLDPAKSSSLSHTPPSTQVNPWAH